MPAVIEVDHVTKEFQLGQLTSFGQNLRNGWRRLRGVAVEERAPFKALDDISFSVEQGEVLGIIGHNGAGKSTLLKILANISQPTRGAVHVHGRVAPLIEVGAGMVPDMTGRENIFLNASILGMSRDEIKRKFDEIVAFSELEDFIDTPVKRYSSGMQVKLGFSIATSVEAEVLIVDEVLAVGDLAFQRKCFDRMESLIKRQGRTVLLVSHNIRQVERLCSRVIVMDHGRKVIDGPPQESCNRYYEQSDQRILKDLAVRGPKLGGPLHGSDALVLESIQLLDDVSRPLQQLIHGQPLTVRLNFRAGIALKRFIVGLGVHTPDLLYIANDDSILSPRGVLTAGPGPFSVDYCMPAFRLFPGTYAFRVGVAYADSDQALFYDENLQHFQVAAGSLSRSRLVGQGFLSLGGDWRMVPAQDAGAARSDTVSSW